VAVRLARRRIGIERRSCKHIRQLRGDAAEEARIGSALPAKPVVADGEATAPPLLLAETWDGVTDPTGWLLSEKLDGVRAYFDGKQFISRQGNLYHAPDWFVAGLPNVPLDGELWLGRKAFQRTVSIVRRQDQSDHWKQSRFVVFDSPKLERGFEDRLAFVKECLAHGPEYAQAHEHLKCHGVDHLRQELARLEGLGAEGVMLRRPGSRYESGRSSTLLKVKNFHDSEARVIDHQEGAGRHKGRLGALLVELADGKRFAVGTGLSDAERENPPAIGSVITFRYQELSDGGVPRFPSFVGVREEAKSMSHVVTVKCQLRDPIAIAAACHRLGLAAPVEGTAQLFSGQESGLIVQFPGWNHPAVIDVASGEIRCDTYEGKWGDRVPLDAFLQMYAVERTKIEARKKGHAVTETTLQDGSIRLQIATA